MINKYQVNKNFRLFSAPQLLTYSLADASNDTTKAIKFCIRYSIDSFHMPSVSSVLKKYKFGDSILLTSEKLSLKYLPLRVDSMNFKIMNQNKLCQLLMTDTDFSKQPNYLFIKHFARKNNLFSIVLESINCGRYPSGGGLYFQLIKEADSFRIISKQGFNIN